MAQKDIEQWAKMLQEAEAEDKAYEKACNDALKEAEDAINDVELGDEDEVIDPASLGFIDSEDGVAEDDMLDGRPHNGHLDVDEAEKDDEVDLAECGFSEDGKELQEKEAEEDLQETFHKDDEYASMELGVEGSENFDGDNTSFEDALHAEVPDVMVKKIGLGTGGIQKYRISGFLGDLKEAYAFYLGLYGWDDVVKQGEEPTFNELVVFQDGDTLQEADYREAIAHVFDPVGLKASTANLKANNVCQLSIVKEAVKAEKERRQKALLEADLEGMSDEQLDNLDQALDAGEAVDNDEADDEQERAWLAVLRSMGINSIEEYKAMDPKEFEKRWEASNAPLDAANGFARSKKVYRAYHKPDDEAGGATHTDFSFNPDYHHRVTRAEAARAAVKAEKKARETAPVEFPARGQDTWSLADFGKMLHSLGPKKAKELQKAMLEIAHEDNKDDPEAEANEIMFIKRLFGQKMPTFRDIARAWYPGQDPNKRQQSVNKFCQDTLGNFYQATREATGTSNGGLANFRANVLGNERNFRRFIEIMRGISDKRAANKRSIINMGKKSEEAAKTPADATTGAQAQN